jgi:cation diffusion facilitator CzcD-associated flavoprotein CzcO
VSPETRPATSNGARSDLRFVVIGAGMAGILAAIKLREAGFEDFVIYEKADRLGGTWRENEYPGLSCDVPSHLYSYSFAPNPDWSHLFAPGPEIQAYFVNVARRFGVESSIRYRKEITSCRFEGGRWRIETADGERDEADFVIAATGVLHHPNVPDLPGLADFGGRAFHSARWDHGAPIAGKRVGVVGTGSTAIQIVSALVDEVAELVLFQRTAQWVMPAENPPYGEEAKREFRLHPEMMREARETISRAFTDGFANVLVDATSPVLAAIHDACVANLENNVKDPVLRERLRPDYRAACKRLIMSGGFYAAIQRPNARLVTDRIERMEKAGVRTTDGRLHELDVLVLATGFRVDRFMRPMEVIGRRGLAVEEVWEEAPRAYMAVSIPDFPNFFMLNGPNGPVGNFSLIDVAELQVGYILQLVERVRSGACNEVSASWDAMKRFDADRKEAAKTTIWKTGCKSWYLDRNGVPMAWPWTFDRFVEEMREPRLADYDLRGGAASDPAALERGK